MSNQHTLAARVHANSYKRQVNVIQSRSGDYQKPLYSPQDWAVNKARASKHTYSWVFGIMLTCTTSFWLLRIEFYWLAASQVWKPMLNRTTACRLRMPVNNWVWHRDILPYFALHRMHSSLVSYCPQILRGGEKYHGVNGPMAHIFCEFYFRDISIAEMQSLEHWVKASDTI